MTVTAVPQARGRAPDGVSMIRLIRVELLKLRTVRLSYGLLATGAGLTALFSVLESVRAGARGGPAPLSTVAGLDSIIAAGIWALLMAAVLGVTVSSGEFRHATATLTYLAAPRRDRVLAAKCVAGAVGGAVIGLAGYLVALAAALIIASVRGYPVVVGDATLVRYGLGHVLAAALLAAIGVGLGSLVRSQLAGVIGILVWSIVVESLVGSLFSAVQPYLPYTAATTLSGTQLGGAAFGPAHNAATAATALPFAAAAGLLAGLAIVIAAVSARVTVPRDVT